MKAALLLRERLVLREGLFAELVVWRLPSAALGSSHSFKYRLALVDDGVCVLRYDNEAGKGDHKHPGEVEAACLFRDVETLQRDFWQDVTVYQQESGR